MVTGRSVISGLASAFPPADSQADLWEGFFAGHFAGVRGARRYYSSVRVRQRHAAVSPLVEDISGWSTARRMRRYRDEALPLAKEALSTALIDAGRGPGDLGLLVVVSCTGYSTPGIDVLLARDAGLGPQAVRLLVGQVGCHAALPALDLASDYVAVEGRPAAVVCIELSSLHLQPPCDDPSQIVCHALFGDAAAAAILEPVGRAGIEIITGVARSNLAAADQLAWEITDRGFRMHLSRQLPRLVARELEPLVSSLLSRGGLERHEIAAWAVHPGGPEILENVERTLRLPPESLAVSRQVLAEHGNCSSPTTLLVLEETRRQGLVKRGDHLVAVAFGPGLSAHATLLAIR